MRLIMFGTGPFAVPTFEALIQSPHEVVALFTRPIADSGKRRKTAENPTRDVAESAGLSVFDPMNVNDSESVEQLLKFEADLFVVCDYGQILSRECLAASKLGGINLHGSLLPKYRGAAPINWAIFQGEPVTGITIIHMTAKLDGGPCLIKAETEIGSQETAEQIEPRLAKLGVTPVLEAIDILENWDGNSPIGQIQDPAQATRAPRLKKSDGKIDWSRSAVEIVNQIRAFQPWPGSFTNWHNEKLKQPLRLIIHQATALPELGDFGAKAPGSVLVSDGNALVIQSGTGPISIDTVQPAGKRAMPIGDFLRGRAPAIDDLFQ
ncbi:MAG: methionyl-tRNA formyltransferase [Planctomycetaceae bacterium]|nr:methionyl-tRNA formyltransferase [Planctomycetaceae bacterium]